MVAQLNASAFRRLLASPAKTHRRNCRPDAGVPPPPDRPLPWGLGARGAPGRGGCLTSAHLHRGSQGRPRPALRAREFRRLPSVHSRRAENGVRSPPCARPGGQLVEWSKQELPFSEYFVYDGFWSLLMLETAEA